MLRDTAIAWVRNNCPNQRFQADFIRHLDEAISFNVNCSFSIGEGLTRAFKPYLLHWFAGELFVFQLTRQQAARLGIAPKAIRFVRDHESVPDGPAAASSLSLEGLEFEKPVLSDLSQPITANCQYRVTCSLPAQLAFRMDFAQGANGGARTFCKFAYPTVTPSAAGSISLVFEPGNLVPGTKLNAVMAVFIRCYETNPQPAIHWRPISNPVAATLELSHDFKQMA